MSNFQFKCIVIVGLGLLGGSIAKAVKNHFKDTAVYGVDIDEPTLKEAGNSNIFDEVNSDITRYSNNADLIIICTPLSVYSTIFSTLSKCIKPHCIITDVGSAKAIVERFCHDCFLPEQLPAIVPAHPIAGAETSGFSSANAILFDGKRVIITPLNESKSQFIDALSFFWQSLGAHTEIMEVSIHDAIYAKVSHVVHVLAFAYAAYLKETDTNPSRVGALYPKFYRICHVNVAMWEDILMYNGQAILLYLDEIILHLSSILQEVNSSPEELVLHNNALKQVYLNCFSQNISVPDLSSEDSIITVLPIIIAISLLKTAEHINYAGTGFEDFTSPILNLNKQITDVITHHKTSIIEHLQGYLHEIAIFRDALAKHDPIQIRDALERIVVTP